MELLRRRYVQLSGLYKLITTKKETALSLGAVLEKQAERFADRPLILFEGRVITYGQFNEAANRYAWLFLSHGFKKGDIVALLMGNRPEFLIAHAGLAKAGIVPALVNSNIKGSVLAHALNIADANGVIVGHEFLKEYLEAAGEVRLRPPRAVYIEKEGRPGKTPEGVKDIAQLIDEQPDANPLVPEPVTSFDILEYIYTSGTTGMPKATKLSHHNWLQLGYGNGGYIFGILPGEVHYCCLPLYHNSGINIAWAATLMYGGTLALRRKFSATSFLDDVRSCNAKTFVYVGELCRYLNNLPEKPDDGDNPLRTIVGNGMRGDYWREFQKRFKIGRIVEVYGSTEGVGALMNLKGKPGMIGRLREKGVRLGYVVRYDMEKESFLRNEKGYLIRCNAGERGMYLAKISSRTPFKGYKNNNKATNDKVLEDVFKKGDRYFISGDLMEVHRGNYVSFVDRLGDTFRWKGEVVATNEVADVINRFGVLEDANVYGVLVDNTEGRCGMVAVTPLDGKPLNRKLLAECVIEKLPVYARPYFLRVREHVDSTASFKKVKTALQGEGFNPEIISDPLYFLDVNRKDYVKLTPALYKDIQAGKVRV